MGHRAVAAILSVVVLSACGCTTAAKQAVYTIRGPEGDFLVEDSRPPGDFASYSSVVVEPFENDLPHNISSYLVAACQQETVSKLAKAGYFQSVSEAIVEKPAHALLIRGKLLDITSDRVPGQRVISGGNHLIAHVQLVDAGTGDVMAWGVVRGVVKSVAQREESNLAEGLAEGVVKFIKNVAQLKGPDKERGRQE